MPISDDVSLKKEKKQRKTMVTKTFFNWTLSLHFIFSDSPAVWQVAQFISTHTAAEFL